MIGYSHNAKLRVENLQIDGRLSDLKRNQQMMMSCIGLDEKYKSVWLKMRVPFEMDAMWGERRKQVAGEEPLFASK